MPGSDGKVEKLRGSDKILPSLIGVVSIFLICQVIYLESQPVHRKAFMIQCQSMYKKLLVTLSNTEDIN